MKDPAPIWENTRTGIAHTGAQKPVGQRVQIKQSASTSENTYLRQPIEGMQGTIIREEDLYKEPYHSQWDTLDFFNQRSFQATCLLSGTGDLQHLSGKANQHLVMLDVTYDGTEVAELDPGRNKKYVAVRKNVQHLELVRLWTNGFEETTPPHQRKHSPTLLRTRWEEVRAEREQRRVQGALKHAQSHDVGIEFAKGAMTRDGGSEGAPIEEQGGGAPSTVGSVRALSDSSSSSIKSPDGRATMEAPGRSGSI